MGRPTSRLDNQTTLRERFKTHLNRLEVFGFKSFADRVVFEFAPGVTALVGPNGSGKSNVVDALRWVFGEQNPRLLRGVRWEEVIFAGSPGRRPLGLAQASVTLDNSTGSLDIPYREVEISRRLLRSGESEYSINRVPCRLKDILDLTAGTGAAGAAYAYVPQAAVDEILKSRPEDRREVIEDAAGLSRYQGRRQEAQRRLSDVDVARERLGDLVTEIEGQIQPLLAEAETAERYVAMRSELEDIALKLWADSAARLERRLVSGADRLTALRGDRESLAASHEQLQRSLEAVRSELSGLRRDRDQAHRRVTAVADEATRLTGEQAVLRERLTHVERESQAAKRRSDNVRQRRAEVLAELERLSGPSDLEAGVDAPMTTAAAKAEALLKEREACLSEARQLERAARGALEATRALYVGVSEKAAGARAGLESLTARLRQWQHRSAELARSLAEPEMRTSARPRSLAEAKDRLAASRAVMKSLQERLDLAATDLLEAREAAGRIRGQLTVAKERLEAAIAARNRLPLATAASQTATRLGQEAGLAITPLLDLITVEPGYERAVGTALGLGQHALVAGDWSELLRIVEAREALGLRGVVALLQGGAGDVRQALDLGGVSPLAAMVRTREPGVLPQGVIDALLAPYGVVDEFREALRIWPNGRSHVGIVSRDGRAVLAGGLVVDGVDAQEPAAIELAQIEQELSSSVERLQAEAQAALTTEAETAKRHAELTERHQQAAQDQASAEEALNTATAEREAAVAGAMQLEARLDAANAEVVALEEQIESATEDSTAAGTRAEQLRQDLDRHTEAASLLRVRLDTAEGSVSQARAVVHELTLKRARMDQEQQARQERLVRLEAEASSLGKELSEATDAADATALEVKDIRGKLDCVQTKLQQLREQHENAKEKATDIDSQAQAAEIRLRNRDAELSQVQRARHDLDEQIHRQELLLERLAGEQLSLEVERKSLAPRHLQAAQPQQVSDGPALRARREKLESALSVMGAVNPGAAEQVKRLQARLAFLNQQEQDLADSATSLAASALELDREIETRFLACFSDTRESFAGVFANLFGGGRADLELTDPESPLTSGVEILAQPPGKRMTSLALLSGGERALTAIALLFAMLTRQVAGFCVLDEVDAHLDEPNCLRFRRYLRSLATERQFLVVTHNKTTMEAADLLYGLTMEEDGVSRVISARLAQQRAARSGEVD